MVVLVVVLVLTEVYQELQQTVEGEPWYASSPWTWDWNAEIAQNSANVDSAWSETENRSTGILRNSINRQNTYGLISKLNYDVSDDLKFKSVLIGELLVLNTLVKFVIYSVETTM